MPQPVPPPLPLAATVAALALAALPAAAQTGRFLDRILWDGVPCTTGTTSAPEKRLAADLIYLDSRGARLAHPVPAYRWTARAGLCSDGASIPGWAQREIGAPFDPLYERPAAIHDWYTRNPERSFLDTHWVFYDALRSEGVPRGRALTMYFAVLIAAPYFALVKTTAATGVSVEDAHALRVVPLLPGAAPFAMPRSEGSGGAVLLSLPQALDLTGMPDLPALGLERRVIDALEPFASPDPIPGGVGVLALAGRGDDPEVRAAIAEIESAIEADPDAYDESRIEALALRFLDKDDRAVLIASERATRRIEAAIPGPDDRR